MALETTTERKRRATHQKVRSGCQTCKVRRKKCDETHPCCLACTNTGRVCEYVETPDRRKRAVRDNLAITTARNPARNPAPNPGPNLPPNSVARRLLDPSQVGLSLAERRYLDLFKTHTSRKCTGYMVDDFWQRLVHQVAEEEPAVRHAAIALSSMHWKFMQETDSFKSKSMPMAKPRMNKILPFTLAQCAKALVSLRQRLTKGDTYTTSSAHREAVLVSCIMLVSLSLFQGDAKAVTAHLRSGYSVLMEWQKVNFDGNPSGLILMRTFSDLQLHRITFSQPQHDIETEAEDLPIWKAVTVCRPVYGYSEASESDFAIVLGAAIMTNYPQGFELRVGSSLRRLNTALADLLYQNSEEKTVIERVTNWKNEFHAFFSAHKDTLSPQDRGPIILIELWTLGSEIILASLKRPLDQMSYDSSLPIFQRMKELAALYLSLDEQASVFSTKPMLLQVLHFSATKCRDWHTRQETLRLVRNSPRREGFWTSDHFVATIEHVIKVESAGLTPNDVIPRAARIDMMHLSPLNQSKFSVWYHRPCTPEEVANCADDHGKWTNVVLSA
ncbi:uncharacterized protein N7479_008917 [Penicillium vulpinum]|uniref:Zn(2)-C6 fungal-type domain-containing protein n=1 Tax=Penicillium vulpinum TaxID=29845 RepID=A0A1V6RFV1_9EURO|nr:uncharacterized protein N7479_008917 [Penicillium vulpinum]KAJ5950504.1 hypothetical protein N7479_008917 [Penicillium vulpinum]OQE00388.1 hypothetical protein PENVUL_c053G02927 [Penicillium vulpinum]